MKLMLFMLYNMFKDKLSTYLQEVEVGAVIIPVDVDDERRSHDSNERWLPSDPLMGVGLGVGPMGVGVGVPGVGVPLPAETNVGHFIEDHKRRADSDPNAPPFDDLRNYAYEGGGSTAGSLSSLASGNTYLPLKRN